ncbi:hypothetical protein C0989_005042 [Termitomyces sp. Mn162]|nr:hypothetical protein C0989_005042 [Termitomyces sp. Mn162]
MLKRKLAVVAIGFLCYVSQAMSFNPRDYSNSENVATCKAYKRLPEPEIVEIAIRYANINPSGERGIIMVHGWPSLWSSWSNQIEEFKNDFHLIVPDLRGFGHSTHSGDPRSSGNMGDMVADLVCVLEHAKVAKAICMGHDWGSQICYEAARMRPDIFTAVIGAVVPYIPTAGPFVPVRQLVSAFPRLTYQLYFDSKLDAAVAELDKDIRRTIRATLRTVDSPPPDAYLRSADSFLDAWSHVDEIPPVPFFSPEEEDYFVERYRFQGFKYSTNMFHALSRQELPTISFDPSESFDFTQNRHASWELAHKQGNFTIPVPALAVHPLHDPVADWNVAAKLLKTADFVPNLTTKFLEGAHWVHIENPVEFNGIVREWLRNLDEKDSSSKQERDSRMTDEL